MRSERIEIEMSNCYRNDQNREDAVTANAAQTECYDWSGLSLGLKYERTGQLKRSLEADGEIVLFFRRTRHGPFYFGEEST